MAGTSPVLGAITHKFMEMTKFSAENQSHEKEHEKIIILACVSIHDSNWPGNHPCLSNLSLGFAINE